MCQTVSRIGPFVFLYFDRGECLRMATPFSVALWYVVRFKSRMLTVELTTLTLESRNS